MNDFFTATVNYTDMGGEDKSIDCKLKFLSPALRSQILKFDLLTQATIRKHQNDTKGETTIPDNRAKLEVFVKELYEKNPDITEDELVARKNAFFAELVGEMSEEQMQANTDHLIETYGINDRFTIEFFQLLVKTTGLSPEDKDLILSNYDSEFWQNVDIRGVQIINESFRLTYPL